MKQNLHTHTAFCDGIDTPRQMLETAIKKGFSSIGFSGHTYMFYAPDHSMSREGTEEYFKQIAELKKEYDGSLDVFCGLECDMYSEYDLSRCDYSIGSVHYLLIDGEYVGFDRSQQEVERIVNTCFGGDGMKYAKIYYETMCRLTDYGNFDIVGHFDLITKHSENKRFFDETSKEYLSYAVAAAEALSKKIPFFEVNTGAIARGYRISPYPTRTLLKELKRLGFGAVISSDCHDATQLDCGFDMAAELLKSCGFEEKYILTNKGFASAPLD